MHVANLLLNHRDQLFKMHRGDYSDLPKKLPGPAPALNATTRFAGYQLAFLFCGWFVNVLAGLLLAAFVVVAFVLPHYIPGFDWFRPFVASVRRLSGWSPGPGA